MQKQRKNILFKPRLIEAENGHFYSIKDAYLPSSTNILECFPNPGLTFWRENTDASVIKQKQEDGKIQGSKVHHCCYLLSLGETINSEGLTNKQINLLGLSNPRLIQYLKNPLTKRERKCIESFQVFYEDYQPETLKNEMIVYSLKNGYAGTLDWIGYLWNKKTKKRELWIIDYKISNSHSLAYDLQIASYYYALNESRKKRYKLKLGLLYLGKSTKKGYQLKESKNKHISFKNFLITKKLWHFLYPNVRPKIPAKVNDFKVKTYKYKGKKVKF